MMDECKHNNIEFIKKDMDKLLKVDGSIIESEIKVYKCKECGVIIGK